MLSNGTSLNDLQWPFQGHDYSTSNNLKMVQHNIYNGRPIESRMAPFSMTLNDQFQGHAILWRWISQKRYYIRTQCHWNTNRDLHTPYSTVSFQMILSDLAKYSMTRSVTRSLCDSWASCYYCKPLVSVCVSSMIDWLIRMYCRTVYFTKCRVKLVKPSQREPSCRKTRDLAEQVVLSRPHSSYPHAFTCHNVQKYVRFVC